MELYSLSKLDFYSFMIEIDQLDLSRKRFPSETD